MSAGTTYNMNPYRKLLVLASNELINQGKVSFEDKKRITRSNGYIKII